MPSEVVPKVESLTSQGTAPIAELITYNTNTEPLIPTAVRAKNVMHSWQEEITTFQCAFTFQKFIPFTFESPWRNTVNKYAARINNQSANQDTAPSSSGPSNRKRNMETCVSLAQTNLYGSDLDKTTLQHRVL